ncbi:hypothetical protein ES711_05055 [Gelidibacter salicanalis]|uniref:Uncharacterized protein n=1 Tax=Gelidibacter salicanalis TaxID=291193 RepID=A0A5C7AKH1_9FLAO|nr:hypothetical protein [Gelidibacter salicanalis]TXE09300.1 hypothetical protein ES711_05055 [Gelidibacter salicanalis]
MYSFFKFLRSTSAIWNLSFLVLLVSCKTTNTNAYFHTTLYNAAEKDKRVIITTEDNYRIKFKNVVFENDSFFGMQRTNKVLTKVPLDLMTMESVRTESKVMLGVAKAVVIGIVGALMIAYVIADILYGSEDDE